MKYRAECKVNGLSFTPRPLQIFGQDVGTCRSWAKKILTGTSPGYAVEIYENREVLVDVLEPPPVVKELPK